ncbi:MAG: hypothetical protein AVDCRST_MAG86-520 [uncultured Truepera sp.]|uniref:Uncharacterized protein n=1 Tax=uncultured Truepera sp. TaxID=543023 RepID=A0A6J4UVN0_9DEIN|nr:MAG: hypothetical protein AVDCRST_MAG86-520 [uncultured Truepera sp.]
MVMTMRASGPFKVTMEPQTQGASEGPVPGKLLLDKHFHGDLSPLEGQAL